MRANLGPSLGFDLYPVLKRQFENPDVTSVDIHGGHNMNGPALRRVTREDFERERLVRDVARLNRQIGRSH